MYQLLTASSGTGMGELNPVGDIQQFEWSGAIIVHGSIPQLDLGLDVTFRVDFNMVT